MSESDNRKYMGTAEEARARLAEKARAWRNYCQPAMGSAAQMRKLDAIEREARFELANAALLWLWHEENPTP